jgi:glucuronoarabinoxylan endo-1,4-beta-xylanase
MTEHLNTDTSITGVIQTAKEMVDSMAIGNYNAYLWWYLKRFYGPIDDNGNRTKIVAVNTGTSAVNQTFSITGGTVPATFLRYRTSASEDLATLGTINTSGGSFTASLPGNSITSFVSQ